jgi:hypothetical protein
MPHSLPDNSPAAHHQRAWWVNLYLLLRRAARELGANDPLRLRCRPSLLSWCN